MTSTPRTTTATIVPNLTYRDAPAAIEWLASAFGFEQRLVVPGDDGTVVHAELWLGDGVVMIGSQRENVFRLKSPRELAGINQSLYLIVDDVDAHCERARAAGGEIVSEPDDKDYGGRGYTARDPEGHVWSFGSYAPAY